MTQFYGYGYRGASRGGIHLLIALAIVVFGVISYFAHTSYNPVTGEKQHVAITPEQEIQLGLQSAPRMASDMGGEVDASDPQAIEVSKVGNRVVSNSDAGQTPYEYKFHLLRDTQTVNAFALPGGQIFITRGLLDRLGNEAQLAGVLGHESGHVAARHAAQQLAQSHLLNDLVLATGVGASNSNHPSEGVAAATIASALSKLETLRYSRADESQADLLGLRFMSQAGYDPRAMAQVMEILKQVTPTTGREPEFLVTHPYPENRIQHINAWIQQHYPSGIPSGLTLGQNLRNGVAAGYGS